jgi:hypothetical protein
MQNNFIKYLISIQKVEDNEKELAPESLAFVLESLSQFIVNLPLTQEFLSNSRIILKEIL